MNVDKKHYYNIGSLSKLLHVSKKTFYSQVIKLENFPAIIELTPTFKLVQKSEFDAFADWYHHVYKKQEKKQQIELINQLLQV